MESHFSLSFITFARTLLRPKPHSRGGPDVMHVKVWQPHETVELVPQFNQSQHYEGI